ncbi:MAG: tRNA 2-thiouridine(34) synthase MnmA [Lachnospiraceae bacterium]|nr:tRNA 2-thiouridine(34) synthase MnmA [Lachnospiraceae bacterium]
MKAMIAMSGGVDSSVAAYLMKEKGYECAGVNMHLYSLDEEMQEGCRSCCTLRDADDALRVALSMGMPFEVKNYQEEFRETVMERFVSTYRNGATPNPCIDCNRYMKFEKLLDYALSRGYDTIATGHYARIEKEGDRYLLKKAVNPEKDQSYVLFRLTQEQLAHTVFPLGALKKEEVRRIAEEQGFGNAQKKESQDICFVPDGDYARFIEEYCKEKWPEGDFTDREGKVLGRHKGIIRYTIGQRKGLGLPAEEPWYVTGIDVKENRVILSHGEGLFTDTVYAEDINLISVPRIEGEMRVTARIRYRQKEQPATLVQEGEDRLKVVFDEPQRAVTKGQSLVIYQGDTVLGGGAII